MGSRLQGILKIFSSGIFIVFLFIFSVGEVKDIAIEENSPNEVTLENPHENNFSSSIDWQDIIVSGRNTTSTFSHDKNNTQTFGSGWFWIGRWIAFFQPFICAGTIKGWVLVSLMDQMHHIFFFF